MRNFDDLRSDQQSCIDALYSRDRAFVVMRMGGGKTATALTAIDELIRDGHRRRAIVVAPPLVAATVWPGEPAKWEHLSGLTVEAPKGGPAERAKRLVESDADVLVFSDGVLGWLVEQLEALPDDSPLLDIFAYDEPKLKEPRGAIGKLLCRVSERQKTLWVFSGTPRPNGYEDLFMPARVLAPHLWGDDFDDWRRRNFMPMDFHGYRWEVHDFRARQLNKDVQTFMVQAAEPPDTRKGTLTSGAEFDIEVDLPPAARKKYKEMERDLIVAVQKQVEELDGDVSYEDELVVALTQAVASSKLAQLAQGFLYGEEEDDEKTVHRIHAAKIDALTYQLDALGDERSVICYGFRDDLARVSELLKKQKRSYGVLGGGRSIAAKMRDVVAWNEGRLDNLILHPASAGHGVELQFGGRRMLWYTPTWSPEQYDQTLKRLDRPGQERQVYSHQIIARDTVDIVKRNRVEYKMRDQDAFKGMLGSL